MHTRRALELIPETWDITLDATGRLKLAEGDLSTAQNVANEARLFIEDAYFHQDRGIPHFMIELGRRFIANDAILRAYLRRAARQAPDVKEILKIEVEKFDPETRKLSGVIEFSSVEGSGDGPIKSYF